MKKRRPRKQTAQNQHSSPGDPETMVASRPSEQKGAPESPASETSRTIIEWILLVAPPTTLITALAFWFGYALTNARNTYYGIDISTLGFSTTDYLLRSVDALITPAVVILVFFLALLGMHVFLWPIILARRWYRSTRVGIFAVTILGLLSVCLSVRAIFVRMFDQAYLAPPILLGAGCLIIAYALKARNAQRKKFGVTSNYSASSTNHTLFQTVLVALIIVSLFWGTSLYAGALGRGRAIQVETNLSRRPATIVYTKTSLSLPSPVTETRIAAPDSQYKFRYTNLRLLVLSDQKYFLLPDGWTHEGGTAVVLRDDDNIRVEFQPGALS